MEFSTHRTWQILLTQSWSVGLEHRFLRTRQAMDGQRIDSHGDSQLGQSTATHEDNPISAVHLPSREAGVCQEGK
jgi:hypothetical protein